MGLGALAYSTWLGAHWLPLSYSSAEIPVFVSRLWDLEREVARSGHIPWWTPTFMNGSSEALPYAGDFPLVPWAILARVFDPLVAGKLVALLSIATAGVTMFLLARRLLRSDAAAVLSGSAYMLHPLLLARAGGAEHIGVVVFIALLPVSWLFLVRLLETGRLADVTGCAITLALMVWTQNKHMAIELPFFAAFAAWSLWKQPLRRPETLRALALLALLLLLLSAFIVVPSLVELKLLKLFEGDPFEGWQRMYSVASLGALVHRSAEEPNYAGLALLSTVGAALLFPRGRRDPELFALLLACAAAAVALGHGHHSVAEGAVRAFSDNSGDDEISWGGVVVLFFSCATLLLVLRRSVLATWRARALALTGLAAFLLVPWFRIFELVPLYRDIRAPEVCFQVPGPFFGSLLAGFFVTDVVAASKLASKEWLIVGVLAAFFVIDAWPFEAPMFESNVTPEAIANARTLYAALGEEAKRDPGKVYVVTSRCFHALGPSWGGPPFTTEAALEYMAPRGTGRLALAAGESFPLRRAYLDLLGVRWVVFDKSDPYARASGVYSALAIYRKLYPLDFEDDDFAVFRVPDPHPYVSGYTRTALAYGDPQRLPELAMALASEGYLLVHADGQRLEDATPEAVAPYAAIYAPVFPTAPLAPEILAKTFVLRGDQPHLPPKEPRDEAITNLSVTRESAETMKASFDAKTSCIAVVDESQYPYWHATLDGQPVEILRVAYGLMGVRVAQGPHNLVLRYETPRVYGWSALVSVGALIAALVGSTLSATRRTVAD